MSHEFSSLQLKPTKGESCKAPIFEEKLSSISGSLKLIDTIIQKRQDQMDPITESFEYLAETVKAGLALAQQSLHSIQDQNLFHTISSKDLECLAETLNEAKKLVYESVVETKLVDTGDILPSVTRRIADVNSRLSTFMNMIPNIFNQADNPYVHKGYRVNFSFVDCVKSLFFLHNEWGNIWSHLGGCIFVLFCLFFIFTLEEFNKADMFDKFVHVSYLCCVMFCLLNSSIFHCFNASCYQAHCILLKLDLGGISVLIAGSVIPLMYYFFQSRPTYCLSFICGMAVFGIAGIVGPFFKYFTHPDWLVFRNVMYSIMAAIGLFPLLLSVYWNGLDIMVPVVIGLVIMWSLYLFGVVINLNRLPERWFPGKFDIWFQSHTIWHFLVLIAAVVHYYTIVLAYRLRRDNLIE